MRCFQKQTVLLFSGVVAAMLARNSEAQPVTPPFRTPQALMDALQQVYERQDKQLYWKLHCWSNVSAHSESVFKATAVDNFKPLPTDKYTYSDFAIYPAQQNINAPRKLPKGTVKYNLPVRGYISFRCQGVSCISSSTSPLEIDRADRAYFGQTPEGNYWLAVENYTPFTNAAAAKTNSAAGASTSKTNPPARPVLLTRVTPLNFTSPEATIQTMVMAYCTNDLEAAAKCMDFVGLAAYKLRQKNYGRPPANDALLAEAAKIEKEWRESFTKWGLPDYRSIRISEVKKPLPEDGGFGVDCTFHGPDAFGRLCLKMTHTQAGWKFIFPPNRAPFVTDNTPFYLGL